MRLEQLSTSISQRLTEIEQDAKKLGAEAIQQTVAELFEKHPNLYAFWWEQYAPYFNDGDPCVFSVHDIYYTTTHDANLVKGKGDFNDENVGYHELRECGRFTPWNLEEASELEKDLCAFEKALKRAEDIPRLTYGEDCRVLCRRFGGITIEEEVDHD